MFSQAGFAHGVSAVLAHFEWAFKWLAAEATITPREQIAAPRFNECGLGLITCPLTAAKTAEFDFSFSKISVC
jgi:hypothetical protein